MTNLANTIFCTSGHPVFPVAPGPMSSTAFTAPFIGVSLSAPLPVPVLSSELPTAAFNQAVPVYSSENFRHVMDVFQMGDNPPDFVKPRGFDGFQSSIFSYSYWPTLDLKKKVKARLTEVLNPQDNPLYVAQRLELINASDATVDAMEEQGWSLTQKQMVLDSILNQEKTDPPKKTSSFVPPSLLVYADDEETKGPEHTKEEVFLANFRAIPPTIEELASHGWTAEMLSQAIYNVVEIRDDDTPKDMRDAFEGLRLFARALAGSGWSAQRQEEFFNYVIASCVTNFEISVLTKAVACVMENLDEWTADQQYANIPFISISALLQRRYANHRLDVYEGKEDPSIFEPIHLMNGLLSAGSVPGTPTYIDQDQRSLLFSALFPRLERFPTFVKYDFERIRFLTNLIESGDPNFQEIMDAISRGVNEGRTGNALLAEIDFYRSIGISDQGAVPVLEDGVVEDEGDDSLPKGAIVYHSVQ